MRILTAEQMRAAEKAAVERGTSYSRLMDNAGQAAARALAALAGESGLAHTALFLCGRGNNAGDAFVAARLLAEDGWQCQVLPLCGGEYSDLAASNFYKLPPAVRKVDTQTADWTAALLVDGVFGIGFHGQLPDGVRNAFQTANAAPGFRVALDLPSGLYADSGQVAQGTFRAGVTLTFGAGKPGLLALGSAGYTGQIQVLDIGL